MSENTALLVATVVTGSASINKHVEGHFGKCHHGGREDADTAENTVCDRVKKSPGVKPVNA